MYIPENIALEDADYLSLFKEISSNAEQIELEEIEIISKKKSEYVPVPIKMNELLKSEEKPSGKYVLLLMELASLVLCMYQVVCNIT